MTQKVPEILLGRWIVITEDGIWASGDDWTYRTKSDAIDEISSMTLDSRPTPLVKRIQEGEYIYTPKDVDTGQFHDSYTVKRVTIDNVHYLQELAREQWANDRGYDNDED